MKKITWKQHYSVGVETLDEQHKKIIGLINQLEEHKDDLIDSETMDEAMTELLDYSRYHLKYEEDLLQSVDYPELAEHKNSHLHYTDTIAGYTIEAISRKSVRPVDFINFLKFWWTEHILQEDMKYKSYFEEKNN